MDARQIQSDSTIRPLDVVMICIVGMTVAGSMLLLSAAKPTAPVDGAIEWHEESLLRAVVQLLCLNYQVPTFYSGAIKNFILGIGAGLALLGLTVAVISGARTIDEEPAALGQPVASPDASTIRDHHADRRHIAPLLAAQVLVGLYLLWSFASSRWATAPQLAVGASILLAIPFLWSFALGRGLTAHGATIAARAVALVTVLIAAIAIWYHYGRNPTLRAEFPAGNPTFLAACLIPGMLISIGTTITLAIGLAREVSIKRVASLVAGLLVISLGAWAFYLTKSRGPTVGLVAGLLAMPFFALRDRRRWIPALLCASLAVTGYFYYARSADAFSPTNRDATIRLRTYAWSYAWRMFNERPFRGHGQGGFTLTSDSYAVDDALDDPLVFESRIAHAHNEWLEVMADLGAVGIVLVTAALLLTLRAGIAALRTTVDLRRQWVLIGLMSALVGLVVEECFGVGLRVSGVPTLFFTTLGLIWALSASAVTDATRFLATTRTGRTLTCLVSGLLGIGVLTLTQQDFAAARHAYQAGDALQRDDFAAAADLASRGTKRLSPQRVVTNLFRLTETHLRSAHFLQTRGRNRERRANEGETQDPRLMAFALEDYRLSDEACERASGSLKELVECAPGFINHGKLAYWLNLTRAANAASRNDPAKQAALLTNAQVAIERELQRQPFNRTIALDYARVAAQSGKIGSLMDVLARPLRHHRIDTPFVELLQQLLVDPIVMQRFDGIITAAKLAVTMDWIDETTEDHKQRWAPEKLRLGAMVRMSRGDYGGARDLLESAKDIYASLSTTAPIGAASFQAELADCRFFSDPTDPSEALASAQLALTLAPSSYQGRQLQAAIRTRMVHYFLATGNEDDAVKLLSKAAPAGVTEEDVMRELGSRYYRLAGSILGESARSALAPRRVLDLLTVLGAWTQRAIALNPGDPYAYFFDATIAYHSDRPDHAAGRLREAFDRGLPVDVACQFLDAALAARPLSASLSSLRSSQCTSQAMAPDRPTVPHPQVPPMIAAPTGANDSDG